jgi:hypothetical protein
VEGEKEKDLEGHRLHSDYDHLRNTIYNKAKQHYSIKNWPDGIREHFRSFSSKGENDEGL